MRTIVPNTKAQFEKFITQYNLKVDGKVFNMLETNLIDGLDKLRKCPFMKYCEDNAATLSEPLWYAWITNAVRVKGGRDYVHEYSKLYPMYSRIETERKIAHALADTGPMKYRVDTESRMAGCTAAECEGSHIPCLQSERRRRY